MLTKDKLRRKRETKRVKRLPRKKADRIERDKARVGVKQFLKQQNSYQKTKKKHLPNKPTLKLSGPYRNTLPPCKQCKLRKRAEGSSRCKDCGLYYKRNNKEFVSLPKPV